MAVNENKWGILFCPKGSFRPLKRWEKIEKLLRSEHIDFDYVQSESTGSVERLVNMLINNGYRTIVIVGGDSALNDAVNCLMQAEKETRDKIALGVIPNGVMNDFAHFWGFREGEEEQTVSWLKEHRVRKIDAGRINYQNKKGESCHRYFLNCVNIGLIAAIMNLRRQTRHVLGFRTISFVISFILMMFQRLEYRMHIKINSDDLDRKIMTVCVGNALGYGQTPNAVPYNGLLDVSVVYHPEVMQMIEGWYLFLRGKFLNHRSVHPYRTSEIQFLNTQKAMVGIDGRLLSTPSGPFNIKVEQEVINFLIPARV
ncbi:MAG: lipid kinase [Prevotella sp.]|jgi:YegS/Rv2252/BmrU family lipid kinase|nr:lipid kinase [Prevotella sp.]MCI1281791.1 lipid kinase [Prevotella sp.]